MTDERRYDEQEVARILEQATASEESPARAPATASSATGLTLAQLQEIGAEVGITPDRIAAAARALGTQVSVRPARTFMGVPRSVSHIVPIPRPLTEDEWNRLVVDLRETFGVEGRIRAHGSLRSWNIGNLQVHVEPDGDRWRVRMQTLKGNAIPRAIAGVVAMGTSGIMLAEAALGGLRGGGLVAAAAIGLFGAVQIGFLRAQLPGWASERAAQMEALAERIRRLVGDD